MVLYFRAGGELKTKLKLDAGQSTRRVETEEGRSLAEILVEIGIPPSFVAFAFKNNRVTGLNHIPSDGDVITLQPPVSGG